MSRNNIDVVLENESLKNEFIFRNLDLEQIFVPNPDDLDLENKRLHTLLDWVQKYTLLQSREKMEAEGYLFPPIDQGISPDNDWYLFKRWLKGLPVRMSILQQLPTAYTPKDSKKMDDDEINAELNYLSDILSKIRISVDLNDNVPPKLVYDHLVSMLNQVFDVLIEGVWHFDGCSGYCPGCFQRPWCIPGVQQCWPEDEKIGEMYVPDSVRYYISPSPMSLAILKESEKNGE